MRCGKSDRQVWSKSIYWGCVGEFTALEVPHLCGNSLSVLGISAFTD